MFGWFTNRRANWAGAMPPEARDRFIAIVREYLSDHRLTGNVDARRGFLRLADGSKYRLHDLAKHCSPLDEGEWKQEVKKHLDQFRQREHLDLNGSSRAQVQRELVLRLAESGIVDDVIAREDIPALRTEIWRSVGDAYHTISADWLHEWALDASDAFAIALNNLRAQRPHSDPLDEQGPITYACSGDLAASWALLLDELVGDVPAGGVLFGVPSKHWLLYVRLDSPADLSGIGKLARRVANAFDTQPLPLTRRIYWYLDGYYEEVGCRRDDGKLHVELPIPLAKRLAALAPDRIPPPA